MDFLGLGPMEIILVMVIALAILGPQRLIEMARKAGRAVREMSKVGQELTRTLNEENLPPQEREMVGELKKIGSEVHQSLLDTVANEKNPPQAEKGDKDSSPQDSPPASRTP